MASTDLQSRLSAIESKLKDIETILSQEEDMSVGYLQDKVKELTYYLIYTVGILRLHFKTGET